MQVAAWFRGTNGLVLALLITVCAVFVWRLADGASGYLRDAAASTLVAAYVPLLGGFAVLLAHPHDGVARVLVVHRDGGLQRHRRLRDGCALR